VKKAQPQAELFAPASPVLPEGMIYQPEFLDAAEEAHWIEVAASLPLSEMNYRGYTARRRVASYGGKYDVAAGRRRDAVSAVPTARAEEVRRDQAHAPAALDLPAARACALGLAAQRRADAPSALLDHVSHIAQAGLRGMRAMALRR
jgi:hypothetical protein